MPRNPEQPSPTEIRDRIRSQHRELSGTLVRIDELADAAAKGGAAKTVALRDALQTLRTLLQEHLHYEEYRLPELTTDASSAPLREALRDEHQAQRELLTRVIEELDETAVGQKLLVGVRELIRAIRDDMEHEEAEILSKV